MSYTIFEDTLADMTFTEVEEYAKNNDCENSLFTVVSEYGHEFNREDDYIKLFLNKIG